MGRSITIIGLMHWSGSLGRPGVEPGSLFENSFRKRKCIQTDSKSTKKEIEKCLMVALVPASTHILRLLDCQGTLKRWFYLITFLLTTKSIVRVTANQNKKI